MTWADSPETAMRTDRRHVVRLTLIGSLAVAVVVLSLLLVSAVRGRAPQPIVTFVGDSYTAGSPEDGGYSSRFPDRLAHELNVRAEVVAQPGAGYVARGVIGETFEDEVSAVHADSDLIVIYGSRNDGAAPETAQAIGDAAKKLIEDLHRQAPSAKIVVISPSWVETPLPEGSQGIAEAIKRACASTGARFVNASLWLQHPGAGVIGQDLVHPTAKGHELLAKKIAPIVRSELSER
jgi:lysophospholipase L1-like esterase